MLNLILQWHLDVLVFGVFAFAAVLFADRKYFSLSYDERQRGALRSAAAILILGSIYLATARGEKERAQLRRSIDGFATTYADEMREHGHQFVTADTPSTDRDYLHLIEKQKKWLRLSRNVDDVYTMRLGDDGVVRLIVDSETDYDENGAIEGEREQRTEIGEIYGEASGPMLAAFRGQFPETFFEDQPFVDRWGTWVSSYAPIVDANGETEAIVGVDFSAEEWVSSMLWARASILGFATALILTVMGSSATVGVTQAELLQKEKLSRELGRQTTSLEQANRELIDARDAAEQANRAKSEFLANMSHEIRTPMNGILGLTELLLQSHVTAEQRRSLELVVTSGEALMTVLNDILDFSKIEANMLQIDKAEYEPREIVGNAMKLLGLRAEERGLELTCRIVPTVPRSLIGDAGRIRQVLVNLVGNAIKFTHHGEVAVTVFDRTTENGAREIEFSVRDTGIGIAADRQALIFEPFVQADGSTTRHYGGTGLGLAICTRLVELMGGKIWLESTPGQGSIFSFRIPCEVAAVEDCETAPARPNLIPRQHVLVVDDNPTNRLILEEILSAWRMDVVSVEHGRLVTSAIEKAASEDNPFSLVLLDVHMPDMDGFAVVELISSLPGCKDLPIILLSSSDAVHHRNALQKTKIASWLTKPLKQSELLETILAMNAPADDRNAPSLTSAKPANGHTAGGRLLVVEDNFVNQQLMSRVLSKDGYEVTIAGDGSEAVKLLASQTFDAVLMDCQMPTMDGYEATRRIRLANRLSRSGERLPILALTANAMKGDRDRCLECGMDDFVTKPLSFSKLYESLAKHVRLPVSVETIEQTAVAQNETEAISSSVAAFGDDPESSPEPASESAAIVLNRDELMNRVGGDEELVSILAEAFREDAPRYLADFNNAMCRGDLPGTKKIAHTIKGCAGNLAATRLYELAKSLEHSAVTGDLSGVKQSLPVLEQEVNALLTELNRFAASFSASA